MNIILDLDETLIAARCRVIIDGKEDEFVTPTIHARPFLDDFFNYIFTKFKRVSIWTHGTTEWYNICYERVLQYYMPPGKQFYIIATRDNGVIPYDNKYYTKDLIHWYNHSSVHNEYNTFIVDDRPKTYMFNVQNSIPIKPYYNLSIWGEKDVNDSELLRIIRYIDKNLFI